MKNIILMSRKYFEYITYPDHWIGGQYKKILKNGKFPKKHLLHFLHDDRVRFS